MLSTLKGILSDPGANPQATSIVVAAAVALVLVIAFILIGLALPRSRRVGAEAAAAPSMRGRRLLGCGLALLVVVAGLFAATTIWYRTTSTNTYCTKTCHEMASPTRTWAASSHHGVTCVRCHEGTGWRAAPSAVAMRLSCLLAEATHSASRRTPVPDSRCLECHDRLLDTKLIARNLEPFTHRAVVSAGASCASCHKEQGHVPPRRSAN